jgi:hypothetical protein
VVPSTETGRPAVEPDPEVPERAQNRRFSASYKLGCSDLDLGARPTPVLAAHHRSVRDGQRTVNTTESFSATQWWSMPGPQIA